MKWRDRFLGLAAHVATWSKDPSTRVGAVIADGRQRVVSVGFNGPPRGTDDSTVSDRDRKLLRTLHAEENAILFAQRDLAGCTIYVTHPPCAHCAALIVQAGIGRVVHAVAAQAFEGRWADQLDEARAMLAEAGVILEAA